MAGYAGALAFKDAWGRAQAFLLQERNVHDTDMLPGHMADFAEAEQADRQAFALPQAAAARACIDPRRLRQRMVEELARQGIEDAAVLAAMAEVPRHLFVDEALRGRAYDAGTLPIGRGQTISSPFTVAKMTTLLQAGPGMRVLEIGTGSGYQAAVLASMGCLVESVERLPELHEKSTALLRSLGCTGVRTWLADGTLGLPKLAPFARIIVTAGGPAVPHPLLEQLDESGIMLIPVGNSKNQRLIRVFRRDGSLYEQDCGPAVFVDLVGSHGW